MSKLKIPTAAVFDPLLVPSRYKAAFGGRGSGKSRFFGGRMIEDHIAERGLRSVCIREVQKTLKESSKRLLEDRLKEYRLGEAQGFKVFKEVIATPGDGLITFQGMQDHTAESIKSLEGFGRAWVEEAQTLSYRSLQLLRPTIRAPGSELWFSWNPRHKRDPVDALFRGAEVPTDAVVVQANWKDNPWFTKELEQERLDDLRINPDSYGHIWEGEYVQAARGAYYAQHLAKARAENRVGLVPAAPLMAFRAFWDIGGTGAKADSCSIWIAQFIGLEVRVVDYYEAVGQELSAHVHWMKRQGYEPHNTRIYLPHDGIQHDRVFNVTYDGELRKAGYRVEVIPNQGQGAATQRIEALRKLFPSLRIDAAKCEAGLDAIGWYHEKWDEDRNIGLGPDHDWSSHAADALGLMAVKADDIFAEQTPRRRSGAGEGHWMG